MINRRNDRRRRLMSEEYVSTFVEADDSATDENYSLEKNKSAKRTYAFGADRRSQLKTTDLFPKTLWVIALCGLNLFGIVAGLNVLNVYAPAWRPYIGGASMQAISLTGSGTLASWMLSMMLLLTGLASLQIFALRKHRCDDYGGTYRIWLIVPPIFFIASIAAIVDFEAIIYHLASITQLTSNANESLIPMTIKLSVLALVMLRMLFEIRDSKTAFSMLVVAWLAIAVSTVLNTQWAENRIGSQELAMASANAVLLATISLMLSHMLYVRFVYLHAHGEIAVKRRVAAKSKVRPNKASRTAKSKQPARSAKSENTASVSVAKVSRETASKTSQQSPKKLKAERKVASVGNAAAETPVQPLKPAKTKSASATGKPAQSPPSLNSTRSRPATMSDFQTLLKNKQAEKAAAAESGKKGASAHPSLVSARDDSDGADDGAILKMSKAERRRARKAAKAKRKAA